MRIWKYPPAWKLGPSLTAWTKVWQGQSRELTATLAGLILALECTVVIILSTDNGNASFQSLTAQRKAVEAEEILFKSTHLRISNRQMLWLLRTVHCPCTEIHGRTFDSIYGWTPLWKSPEVCLAVFCYRALWRPRDGVFQGFRTSLSGLDT